MQRVKRGSLKCWIFLDKKNKLLMDIQKEDLQDAIVGFCDRMDISWMEAEARGYRAVRGKLSMVFSLSWNPPKIRSKKRRN